jgi:hypothetical protein
MLFRCLGRIELQILCIVHHDVPVETRGNGPEIVGRNGNAIDKPDRGLGPGITTISIPNAEGVRICVPIPTPFPGGDDGPVNRRLEVVDGVVGGLVFGNLLDE